MKKLFKKTVTLMWSI